MQSTLVGRARQGLGAPFCRTSAGRLLWLVENGCGHTDIVSLARGCQLPDDTVKAMQGPPR